MVNCSADPGFELTHPLLFGLLELADCPTATLCSLSCENSYNVVH